MKALTIREPWASLIMDGFKVVEWRGWKAPASLVGRRLVIHAGLKVDEMAILDLRDLDWFARESCGPRVDLDAMRARLRRGFVRGAGLGTVVVDSVLSAREFLGDGYDGNTNWAWTLRDVERWPLPIPSKGAQGLWDWPY